MMRSQDAEFDGQSFELVIRNCKICTASDVYVADIGIAAGRIICIGTGLPAGNTDIDAQGRIVTPGGVDAHCHLDQPVEPPAKMADDFPSGTRSAACGGTTTVIPFAAQMKGSSLLDAVDDYHRRADKGAYIDSVQSELENMLLELAHRAITEDEADVIITAGAPLAGLAHRVRDRIPVPMVEGVCASVKMAEALCALNPVTPTAGSFRRPARKPTSGLSRALSKLIE